MWTAKLSAAASCVVLVLLSGCSIEPSTAGNSTTLVQGAALQGRVHGGQQPVVGAQVYLFAASTSGYGAASVSLLNNPVTSDSNGGFTITGDYTCPATPSQAYIYAVGGNAGSGVNSAIGFLAALGSCPVSSTFPSSTFILVNEVSTVATAYAIAGYATDATHVSSSGSTLAITGLANAFAAVPNLETLNSGVALATTPALNGTVPQSEIDTLANILAACINSTGSSSTPCTTLFANALKGASTPTDTATAAINIAHNPGANVSNLFGLQAASGAPFQPTLSSAPNDFTLAITYTGAGMNICNALAIDALGNVWVANGNGSSLSELSPTGVPNASSPFTGGGLYFPSRLAIDASGNVWATNYSNVVSEFSSGGSPVNSTGYTTGGLNRPYPIAIDGSGDAWVGNDGAGSVGFYTVFNSAGVAISGTTGYSGGGLDEPGSVAIDGSNNVWAANPSVPGNVSEFNSSGTPITGSTPYSAPGIARPSGVAIDGSGNVWVSNSYFGANSVTEFVGAAAPVVTPIVANLRSPYGVHAVNLP